MTEEWIHTPITEHDKACVLQSFVEHNVESEHLNSERPFYGRDSCNEKKNERVKKTKIHRQLSSDSSATFVPRRTPDGAPPRTAHIATSSSVAKSQDSSISKVYVPATLTTRHTAAKGSDHDMR